MKVSKDKIDNSLFCVAVQIKHKACNVDSLHQKAPHETKSKVCNLDSQHQTAEDGREDRQRRSMKRN